MSNGYYKLVDEEPVPCTLDEYAQAMTNPQGKIITQTQVGEFFVSTIFLFLDHSFGERIDQRPILFETMIFPSPIEGEEYQEKYCTIQEAREGHEQAVEYAKNKIKNGIVKHFWKVIKKSIRAKHQ